MQPHKQSKKNKKKRNKKGGNSIGSLSDLTLGEQTPQVEGEESKGQTNSNRNAFYQ